MSSKKAPSKRKRIVLSEGELQRRSHIKDIRTTMEHIGFHRISGIDGKNIVYKSRKSEFDDFFIYENLFLIAEYTSDSSVSKHLLNKKAIYDLINQSHREFVEFIISEPKFVSFGEYYNNTIKDKYSTDQIRIRIIYCSINPVDQQLKEVCATNKSIFFYDYNIVYYFRS